MNFGARRTDEDDRAPGKRPLGIALLGGLQWLAALAEIALGVLVLTGRQGPLLTADPATADAFAKLGKGLVLVAFLAAAVQGFIGYGLWTLRNRVRLLAIILLAISCAADVLAAIVYGVVSPNRDLLLAAIAKFCISALIIGYLTQPKVRKAFRN
jgi:hypothetical protein